MKRNIYGLTSILSAVVALFFVVGFSHVAEAAYVSIHGTSFKSSIPDPSQGYIEIVKNLTSPEIKLYVPPHTTSAKLWLYTVESGALGAVARAGGPPLCDGYSAASGLSDSEFFMCLPWKRAAATVGQLRSSDWQVSRNGGTITLVSDNTGSATRGSGSM
jgi:hypothetical protein